MTWKVTNSQDYAPKYVKYIIDTEAVTPGTVDYNFGILAGTVDIDWGDGTSNTAISANTTHTYSSPGSYIVTISQNGTNTFRPDIGLQEISVEHESVEGGGFWDNDMRFASSNATKLKKWGSVDLGNVTLFGPTVPSGFYRDQGTWYNCNSLTSFPDADLSAGTEYNFAWYDCTSMTNFGDCTFNTTPNSCDFNSAWYNCSNLATFPAVDLSGLSSASDGGLYSAWRQCSKITSFGAITLPSATPYTAQYAWYNCSALTSFPALDLSQCTNVTGAWSSCTSLTSFLTVDLSSCTNFGPTIPSGFYRDQGAWYNCNSLTSLPNLDLSSGTVYTFAWYGCTSMTTFGNCTFNTTPNSCVFIEAWYNCNSLTSFPALDFSGAQNLSSAWGNCSGMTSFGAITLPSATSYSASGAWKNCTGLTSFPAINLSQCTNVNSAWSGCTSLTTFGVTDLSSCTDFGPTVPSGFYRDQGAWYNCNSLTSFPALDLSSGTVYTFAWYGCTNLANFPANMFDNVSTGNFQEAFDNCALTAASVENILVSLDTNGVSNGTLGINAGTTAGQASWTTAATTAYNNLVTKGWTITANP